MNSLSSGIGQYETPIYEPQGTNFQNIPQAKSKNLGKDLYLLLGKKKTRPAVFEVFFLQLMHLCWIKVTKKENLVASGEKKS